MAKKKMAARTRNSARAPRVGADGLSRFNVHALDPRSHKMLAALETERASFSGFAAAPVDAASMDAESAARLLLQQALDSDSVPGLTNPMVDESPSEFRSLGAEYVPLTGTTVVKFRQHFHKIPVYGSLVTVELDKGNVLLGIGSASGTPEKVNALAKLAPAEAIAAIAKSSGPKKLTAGITPRLHYYYDQAKRKWRLAYIAEDVPVVHGGKTDPEQHLPLKCDFVVDAHTGSIVASLPRTAFMAAITETAADRLGVVRTFGADKTGSSKSLVSAALNVRTFDFGFRDPRTERSLLPGNIVNNPPAWDPNAVSAHANAEQVAVFLRDTLGRNGIDNRGGAMVSSINCVIAAESPAPREWRNAAWIGTQMIYGQRRDPGGLLSLSINVDVVAHEMFHGVTDSTSRLEYAFESGALNESYSDIFGILVSNFPNPNPATWNWELGEGLQPGGGPFRDLKDPARHGQPAHMRDFRQLTLSQDRGGVHINSGIHNHGAFRIMIAAAAGAPVLTPGESAAIFYLALTQRLGRRSGFADSRRAVIDSARTLFRNLTEAARNAKIAAIEAGFDAVGIRP